MDSPAQLEPTFSAPGGEFAIYCRDQALVLVPAADRAFDVLLAFIQNRVAEVGAPLSMVVLVRPGVRAEASHLRTEVNNLLATLDEDVACMAVAIDGRGFFASTFMSMASGLFMHTRHGKTPLRAFRGPEAACAWVHEMGGGAMPWLEEYVESVRADVESRQAAAERP